MLWRYRLKADWRTHCITASGMCKIPYMNTEFRERTCQYSTAHKPCLLFNGPRQKFFLIRQQRQDKGRGWLARRFRPREHQTLGVDLSLQCLKLSFSLPSIIIIVFCIVIFACTNNTVVGRSSVQIGTCSACAKDVRDESCHNKLRTRSCLKLCRGRGVLESKATSAAS